MPDPTQRQVRGTGTIDGYLTSVSVAFMQDPSSFIADQVFPLVPVQKSTARYRVWPRSYFAMDNVGPRPLGGYPRQAGYRLSDDTYNAEESAIEDWVDDRERADATPEHNIERAKIMLLMRQQLIHRDRDWASAFFRTGVWSTDKTGIASGTPSASQFLQWDNDNSDPVLQFADDQVTANESNGGYPLDVLVLGSKAYVRLLNHPDIVARLSNNATRVVNRDVLATLLGVRKILVPMGVYNSGPEKETVAATEAAAVYSYIVGAKDALLVHAASSPAPELPSAGYTFAWTGLLGGGAFSPAAVNRGRDERAHSDWYQLRLAYDQKVVAPSLGIFYSGGIA